MSDRIAYPAASGACNLASVVRRSSPWTNATSYPPAVADLGRNPAWRLATRAGTRLACADFGGDGPPAVLLHGLAGNAREWDETASWLVETHRVVALDARGHGRSERRPADVSRAAHVADVAFWVRELELGPVALVGQSLGGHTAFLVAARRPDLVRSLIVAEATPAAGPHASRAVEAWLESWPVPFDSEEAAIAFFGGETLWARGWASGLERSGDGLRPRFDADVLVASLAEVAEPCWDDWARITVPTLVVRGDNGVPREEVLRMVELHPRARLVDIARARHDVHLENPFGWRDAVETFLREGA